jgi:hypothetical protein
MEMNAIKREMQQLNQAAIEQLTTLVRNYGGRINIDEYEHSYVTWKCSDNGAVDVDVEALAYCCDMYGHGPHLCIVVTPLHAKKEWLLPIEQFEMGTAMRLYELAYNQATGDKMWEQVTRIIEVANEHLEQEDIKAQIHIEKYQQGDNYWVYVVYDGTDVDVKNDDVLLDDAPGIIEKVWKDLVCCYAKPSEDERDYKDVRLRRLSGDTHKGEANLIYSFADCLLFFVYGDGSIDVVDGDIDRFIGESGWFAVNTEDYAEAMRQVYKHENGFED